MGTKNPEAMLPGFDGHAVYASSPRAEPSAPALWPVAGTSKPSELCTATDRIPEPSGYIETMGTSTSKGIMHTINKYASPHTY